MRYTDIRAVAAGAAIALVLTAVSADARTWQRSGTVTGTRGNTATYSGTRTRTNGVGTSQSVYTGPHGKTAQRTVTRTPQGNGTVDVQSTRIGPSGNTYTRSSSVTH